MPKISVIMPVYNSEQFLDMAVKSVLNQTFEDFELILVNDGSTDNSPEMCDRYKEKDGRVVVIHQENHGICATRNIGLSAARGEYICFIDNDDEYAPRLLEENYELVIQHDADVVKCGYRVDESFADGFVDHRCNAAEKLTVIEKESKAERYFEVLQAGAFYTIWNAIYKRSFLVENNLKFNEHCRFGYEDWVFGFMLYQKVNKMVLNPEIQYFYYQRYTHSTCRKYDDNRLEASFLACKHEQEMLDEIGIQEWMPLRKEEALEVNIAEILKSLNNPACKLKTREKAQRLLDIRNRPFFEVRLNDAFLKRLKGHSKTKYIVVRLFYKKRMKTLVRLSKIYFAYLGKKKRKNKFK